VDEISRLRAVAVDGNRFSSERLVPEDADDATVVAPALTWAVYVEVAEGDCFRVVEVVVDLRISVDGPLVDTVGRGRGFGVRFRDGDCLRFTVDGGARGEDESEILLARASSRRCSVASVFTSWQDSGSSTDFSTLTTAAWWKTISTSSVSSSKRLRFRMSPCSKDTVSGTSLSVPAEIVECDYVVFVG